LSSGAVEAGVGRILHFGCDIFARAPEKVLALRARDIEAAPDVARTLTGAIATAARYMEESRGRQEIAAMLARPDRVSVDARLIQRTLVGELKIAANETRANPNYLILGEGGALRPDAAHAIWLYAQLLRWGQADSSMERVEEATRVFRADLSDAAIGDDAPAAAAIGDPVGAFDASPPVDNLRAYLAGFSIGRKL
jgi:NitT/TauT family transport system ATP-binding protein